MKKISVVAVVAAAGLAASANAGTIFSADFEAPTYAVGALSGQNGWTTGSLGGVAPGAVANVVNNAANAFAGSQYLEVNSTGWTADSASTTYRLSYGYAGHSGITAGDVAANPILHTSLAIRMNTPTGTRGGFSTVNNYDASFNGLGAMGIAWTGAGIATAGPFATPNTSYLYLASPAGGFVFSGSSATSWLNGWFVFDIQLNYATGLISYSVNGSSLDATLDANGFDRSFLTSELYDQSDIQSERDRPAAGSSSGGTVMRYDNYLVELVPAPSTAALLGLGGLVASRRRRA